MGAPAEDSPSRVNLLMVLIVAWTIGLVFNFLIQRGGAETIPYSQFLSDMESGRVAEVTISPNAIRGTLKNAPEGRNTSFETIRVEDPGLTERLEAGHVPFSGAIESEWLSTLLSWIVPLALMMLFWRYVFRRLPGSAEGSFLPIGKAKTKIYVEKDLKTTFDDVAGVDEAKAELSEVVNFLKEPARYARLGGRIPKGVLLVGPPGTGKTLLARAVAGEAKTPFYSINGSEFVELFVGVGAARVRDLFDQARKHAPCIIFIDELDALGRSRALGHLVTGANDEKEQTLNQLLAELDGFDPSQGVVLLAATNRPEILDPALLRAGRFDRQILVDKPDKAGRVEILKVHVRKVKIAPETDLEAVAALTAGFSGADLANLVNEAALAATRREASAVFMEDFTAAIERIVAGLERKKRIMNPEEKRRVAYHEMGHVTVSLSLGIGEKIHKVSVIPRGIGSLGYTISRPIEDRYLMNSRELDHKIAVLLGGRAAESLYFDDVSTGIHDDLAKASDLARAMVTQFGMSGKVGLISYERPGASLLPDSPGMARGDMSETTARAVDEECRRITSEAFDAAILCLKRNAAFVEKAAEELIRRETLDEAEIARLWRESAADQGFAAVLPMKPGFCDIISIKEKS